MTQIVLDTSFLNPFLRTETLQIFLDTFAREQRILPDVVLQEFQRGYRHPEYGDILRSVQRFIDEGLFTVATPAVASVERVQHHPFGGVERGEMAAIALCMEYGSALFANEDRKAARLAVALEIPVIGIVESLQEGIHRHVITVKQAHKLLHLFAKEGRFILKDPPEFTA